MHAMASLNLQPDHTWTELHSNRWDCSAGYHHAARATLPKPIVPVQNAVTLLGLLGYLSWRDHH